MHLLSFLIGAIFSTTFAITSNLFSLIKPLFIAIVIFAYLFFPFTKAIEVLENNKVCKIKKAQTRRVLAITLYFSVIGIFSIALWNLLYDWRSIYQKNTTITNIIEYISIYLSTTSFSTTSINSTIDSLNIRIP